MFAFFSHQILGRLRPMKACFSPSMEELETNRKIREKEVEAREEAKQEAKRRREERRRNNDQMFNENADANEVILDDVPDLQVPDLEDAPVDMPVDVAFELVEELAEENDAELRELLDVIPIARSRRSRNVRPSVRLQEYYES